MNLTGFTGLSDPLTAIVSQDFSPTTLVGTSSRVRSARFSFTSTAITGVLNAKIGLAPILPPRFRLISVVFRHSSSNANGNFRWAVFNKNASENSGLILTDTVATVDGSTAAVNVLSYDWIDTGANNQLIWGIQVTTAIAAGTVIVGDLLYSVES